MFDDGDERAPIAGAPVTGELGDRLLADLLDDDDDVAAASAPSGTVALADVLAAWAAGDGLTVGDAAGEAGPPAQSAAAGEVAGPAAGEAGLVAGEAGPLAPVVDAGEAGELWLAATADAGLLAAAGAAGELFRPLAPAAGEAEPAPAGEACEAGLVAPAATGEAAGPAATVAGGDDDDEPGPPAAGEAGEAGLPALPAAGEAGPAAAAAAVNADDDVAAGANVEVVPDHDVAMHVGVNVGAMDGVVDTTMEVVDVDGDAAVAVEDVNVHDADAVTVATAGSSAFSSFFGRWAPPLHQDDRRQLRAVGRDGAMRGAWHGDQGQQTTAAAVVVVVVVVVVAPRSLLLRSPTARYLRWHYAQIDGLETVARATRIHHDITACDPLLDVDKHLLRSRVSDILRHHRVGARGAYIGSSSDPEWRWRGGRIFRSSGRAGWMDGHRLKWQKMIILGIWPDGECAELEVVAIAAGRASVGHECMENVADDARGLEIRSHPGYSCIYICFWRK